MVGTFFVTRTDDSKTQVPSFCQKKGPKSPKFFQLGSFFSVYIDNVLGEASKIWEVVRKSLGSS